MSNRNNQKQVWSDQSFINVLEDLKAKMRLVGKPVNNVGELTKAIASSEAFKKVEAELLNGNKSGLRIKLQIDGLLKK